MQTLDVTCWECRGFDSMGTCPTCAGLGFVCVVSAGGRFPAALLAGGRGAGNRPGAGGRGPKAPRKAPRKGKERELRGLKASLGGRPPGRGTPPAPRPKTALKGKEAQ